jgi:hypothetical protein
MDRTKMKGRKNSTWGLLRGCDASLHAQRQRQVTAVPDHEFEACAADAVAAEAVPQPLFPPQHRPYWQRLLSRYSTMSCAETVRDNVAGKAAATDIQLPG